MSDVPALIAKIEDGSREAALVYFKYLLDNHKDYFERLLKVSQDIYGRLQDNYSQPPIPGFEPGKPPGRCELDERSKFDGNERYEFDDYIRDAFCTFARRESEAVEGRKDEISDLLQDFYNEKSIFSKLGRVPDLGTDDTALYDCKTLNDCTCKFLNRIAPSTSPSIDDVGRLELSLIPVPEGKIFAIRVVGQNKEAPIAFIPKTVPSPNLEKERKAMEFITENFGLKPIVTTTQKKLQHHESMTILTNIQEGVAAELLDLYYVPINAANYGFESEQRVFYVMKDPHSSREVWKTAGLLYDKLETEVKDIVFQKLQNLQLLLIDGGEDRTKDQFIQYVNYNIETNDEDIDEVLGVISTHNELWKNYHNARLQWSLMEKHEPVLQIMEDVLLLDLSRFGWAPCWSTPENTEVKNESASLVLNDLAEFQEFRPTGSSSAYPLAFNQTTPQWECTKYMHTIEFAKKRRKKYLMESMGIETQKALNNLVDELASSLASPKILENKKLDGFRNWLFKYTEKDDQSGTLKLKERKEWSKQEVESHQTEFEENIKLYNTKNDIFALCICFNVVALRVRQDMLTLSNSYISDLQERIRGAWYNGTYQFAHLFRRFRQLAMKSVSVLAHETLKQTTSEWKNDFKTVSSLVKLRIDNTKSKMEVISKQRENLCKGFIDHAHTVRGRANSDRSSLLIVNRGMTCGMSNMAFDRTSLFMRARLRFPSKEKRDAAFKILVSRQRGMSVEAAIELIEKWFEHEQKVGRVQVESKNAWLLQNKAQIKEFVNTFKIGCNSCLPEQANEESAEECEETIEDRKEQNRRENREMLVRLGLLSEEQARAEEEKDAKEAEERAKNDANNLADAEASANKLATSKLLNDKFERMARYLGRNPNISRLERNNTTFNSDVPIRNTLIAAVRSLRHTTQSNSYPFDSLWISKLTPQRYCTDGYDGDYEHPTCFKSDEDEQLEILLVYTIPVDDIIVNIAVDNENPKTIESFLADNEVDELVSSLLIECPRHSRPKAAVQKQFKEKLKNSGVDVWRMDWWVGFRPQDTIDNYKAAANITPVIPYGFNKSQLLLNCNTESQSTLMSTQNDPFHESKIAAKSMKRMFEDIEDMEKEFDDNYETVTKSILNGLFEKNASDQFGMRPNESLGRVCRIAFQLLKNGPLSDCNQSSDGYASTYKDLYDVNDQELDYIALRLIDKSRRIEYDPYGQTGASVLAPFNHREFGTGGQYDRRILSLYTTVNRLRADLLSIPDYSSGVFRFLQMRISLSSYWINRTRKQTLENSGILNILQSFEIESQSAYKYNASFVQVADKPQKELKEKPETEVLATLLFPYEFVKGRVADTVENVEQDKLEILPKEKTVGYKKVANLYMATSTRNLRAMVLERSGPMVPQPNGRVIDHRFQNIAAEMAKIAEGLRLAGPLFNYMAHAAVDLKKKKGAKYKFAPVVISTLVKTVNVLVADFNAHHAKFEDSIRSYADMASTGTLNIGELKQSFIKSYSTVRKLRSTYNKGQQGMLVHMANTFNGQLPGDSQVGNMINSLFRSLELIMTSEVFFKKSQSLNDLFGNDKDLSKWMNNFGEYTRLAAGVHVNAVLGCATASAPFRDIKNDTTTKYRKEYAIRQIRLARSFDTFGGFIGNKSKFYCYLPTSEDVWKNGVKESCVYE